MIAGDLISDKDGRIEITGTTAGGKIEIKDSINSCISNTNSPTPDPDCT